MKKTRILAAFLASLTLLSSLAACSIGGDDTETTASADTAEETKVEQLKDNLPGDLNYAGDEIVFITSDQLDSEKLTGDPVSDILFERNKAVEQRLNVKITCISDGSAVEKLITAVKSNTADYDILVDKCWTTAPRFVEGYFTDLRQSEYLDFDQIWWNQSFNEVVSFNEKQYGVTGAMVLSLYRRTHTTVFNKPLFTNANQKFLYEYVEDGTWTLDKQTSLVPLFHQDNGNQTADTVGDIYGFISNDFIYVDPYWAACEVDIAKKNADGEYEWIFNTDKMYDMAEKVLALYYGTDGAAYIETDDAEAEATVLEMFSSGYGAMATMTISSLESADMRDMPQEYGVVPIPKYSESQETYRSQMHDGFTIICVPTTVQGERLNELSALLEAMASSSYNLVRPVYYETTLRTKIAQDPQSSAMMDLIINNIYLDAGFVYSHSMQVNGQGFHQSFQQLVASKTNDTASRFKSATTMAKKGLRQLNNKLNKLTEKE